MILNVGIFALIKAQRSLIAIAIKASMQRRVKQKEPFKNERNLFHNVLR